MCVCVCVCVCVCERERFDGVARKRYLAAESYYSKSVEGSKVLEGGTRDLISINPFMKWRLLQTHTSYRN